MQCHCPISRGIVFAFFLLLSVPARATPGLIILDNPLRLWNGALNQGRAFVFSGQSGQLLFPLDLPHPHPGAAFGNAVAAAGDVNQDGVPDLLVGAFGQGESGQAFVFSGKTGKLLYTLQAPQRQSGAGFGWAVAALGDLTGDGVPELVVGAFAQEGRGRVFVFDGQNGKLLRTLAPPSPLDGVAFGWSVASAGDLDQDGSPDILVGAPYTPVGELSVQGRLLPGKLLPQRIGWCERKEPRMETTAALSPDQLNSPAAIADPYPFYRQLRDRSPVNYIHIPGGIFPGMDEPTRAWGLLKYDDVYGALRDHDTFSSARNPLIEKGFFPPLVLITDDPPRHTRFRRLVNKAFTLRRIETLEPWITRTANELLDELGRGEVDIVQSYTMPLPVKVVARLLGIPGEEYVTFKRWSDASLTITAMTPEERMTNIQEMMAYFGKMAATRRSHGAEDLITALVEAEIEGESLQDWEILGFSLLLLIAGNETTTNLVGNILNVLVDQPDLWQQLRENRSLVENVIEETLRYESPVRVLLRVTTRDVEVSGVRIPQGDMVGIFYGAANRDPSGFPNPDEFRLDRDLRNHVAFGMGIHYCLGAPLARAEAKITLNTFLDRFPVLQRGKAPAARQTGSPIVFGFQHLPLVLGRGGH